MTRADNLTLPTGVRPSATLSTWVRILITPGDVRPSRTGARDTGGRAWHQTSAEDDESNEDSQIVLVWSWIPNPSRPTHVHLISCYYQWLMNSNDRRRTIAETQCMVNQKNLARHIQSNSRLRLIQDRFSPCSCDHQRNRCSALLSHSSFESDGLLDRQTDSKTDRQTDRKSERVRETDR